MSYCRKSKDSDVYVYFSDQYVCGECELQFADVRLETPIQMLEHLVRHRKQGDLVPDAAIERLQQDVKRGWYEPG